MLTIFNKSSPQRTILPYTLLFLFWKLFTRHGQLGPSGLNMLPSSIHFRLDLKKSKHITTKLPTQVHTYFACVSNYIYFYDYLFTILVLDPRSKMDHFKRHWDDDLRSDVIKIAEEIVSFRMHFIMEKSADYSKFKERYIEIYGTGSDTKSSAGPNTIRRTRRGNRIVELSDDESGSDDLGFSQSQDDSTPVWKHEFSKYLEVREHVPEKVSIISWWEVHTNQLWHKMRSTHFFIHR